MPLGIPVIVTLSVKIGILVALLLYAVFAGIVIRQEQLMAAVLEEGFEPILRILTILHFAASVALIIFAIIIL
ncbi:MAG: DUF5657 family protein [Patescibacteria group bacterium]